MTVTVKEVIGVSLNDSIVCDVKGFTKKVKAGLAHAKEARSRGLMPTSYFFEALDYVRKARILQDASIAGRIVPKVGDPLMEAIPIYNTVRRRYAGFSNVPEFLWYGDKAPKRYLHSHLGRETPYRPWRQESKMPGGLVDWLYVTLVHRVTGSGASFEADHGFRNNRVLEMASMKHLRYMKDFIADYDGPIFTSIGNQIPPFPKCGGREYLRTIAPEFVNMMYAAMLTWANQHKDPMPIKTAVDMALKFHKALGCKQFKFVITAWVMDMAEYLPKYVDPNSDCYHGKNAMEAIEICFDVNMKKQELYDKATRLFADISGTYPMDVEDASPGCDLVRWIENYVPKKGFEHVIENDIYNGSNLTWPHGRQPQPF